MQVIRQRTPLIALKCRKYMYAYGPLMAYDLGFRARRDPSHAQWGFSFKALEALGLG